MRMLPETIPASFAATYTPIDSAGTEPQKKHLARLLANQMVQAGHGQALTDDFVTKKPEKRQRFFLIFIVKMCKICNRTNFYLKNFRRFVSLSKFSIHFIFSS